MRTAAKSSLRGQAGFTLLELLVVVAILAAVAVLAFPSAERTRRAAPVRTIAIELAAALRTARAEALRSNEARSLVIDLGARRFSGDGLARPRAFPPGVRVKTETRPGAGDPQRPLVRFNPDGTSSGIRIGLAAPRERATVNVDWLTGRTHIEWGR